ncbi:MAG: AAA-associated domain-containing protein [Pyrobaculum sp.]
MRFPPVGVDQVLGLLKVIYALGGRVDVMHINEAIDADLGELSHVIDAAEVLGFVKHSNGDVELTEDGRKAVEMPLRHLQLTLKTKMSALEPFAQLVDYLKREARLEEVLQYIASLGYMEEGARKILDWAVFAQLVEIDDDMVKLS